MKIRGKCLLSPALAVALLTIGVAAIAATSGWVVVPSPNPEEYNFLDAAAAVSASDIWAVGYDQDENNNEFTLAEHWNGTNWSVVPTRSPGGVQCPTSWQNTLYGVAAVSTSDVWAVGFYCGVGQAGVNPLLTLAEHWNGSQWTLASTPNPSDYTSLYGRGGAVNR